MKRVSVDISLDWSFSSVNEMLRLGRVNHFGRALSLYVDYDIPHQLFPEWGMIFEGGDKVASEADGELRK